MEGACGKEHSWPLKAESRSLPTVSKETLVLQPQGTCLCQQAEGAWERLWAPDKDTACWQSLWEFEQRTQTQYVHISDLWKLWIKFALKKNFFLPYCMTCRILVLQPGIKSNPPFPNSVVEVWYPKHWVFIFYYGKINHSLDVQFSPIKYIHVTVQPSSQLISRTFSSSPNEILSPLKLALFEVATFVVNYKQ